MDILAVIKKPFAAFQQWAKREIEIGKLEAKIELDEEIVGVAQDRLDANRKRLVDLKALPSINLFD